MGKKAETNGIVERFVEIVNGLDENDRTEVTSYNGNYSVYIAKIANPRTGNVQVRIELKAPDKFKPTVVVTRSDDLEELEQFVNWLKQRKAILEKLDELNDSTTSVRKRKKFVQL